MFKHEEIIAAILASQETAQAAQAAQWFDGKEWHTSKTPTGMQSGSFTGKAGTMKRSNKGRSSRMPNGSRTYLIDYDTNVVAYRV